MSVALQTGSLPRPFLPSLTNGDRMDAEEFERRYAASPDIKKAELVEGIVYVAPPVGEWHGVPHGVVVAWLRIYRATTPGIVASSNTTLRLDADNQFQPDAYLRILESHGGQARLGADDYLNGGPELAVEISLSTASIDLHGKFRAYLGNDVCEYLVWRVRDGAIDWFIRRGGQYERLAPGADGIIRSETFPGLWLDAKAMVDDDDTRVFEILRQGLASPEHAAFVATLAAEAAARAGGRDPSPRPVR